MAQQGNQEPQRHASGSSSSDSMLQNENSRFTFVLDQDQAGIRNHAMRAHWNERRRTRMEKKHQQTNRRQLPIIAAKKKPSSQQSGSPSRPIEVDTAEEQTVNTTPTEMEQPRMLGVPGQFLTGVNHALASTRLDPFDSFPIRLTIQHHRLIHHWLSTHATMMFENMPASSFNPMRDVWFPLDLSNPASFNAIMAHSAAHLAHQYGGTTQNRGTNSWEALKFKADTVKILTQWVNDPKMALSNGAFAAVVRLLTFERYWGTENEWKIHRTGLEGMIRARGGLHQLHGDWRLELVVGLYVFFVLCSTVGKFLADFISVSLMSKPSWFESTNNLSEISEHNISHNILGSNIDLQKMRCLWLLSFIQDMRNLMSMSSQLYMDGLLAFPSLYSAILLIRDDFIQEGQSYKTRYLASDYDRLACLFAISIMVQESVSMNFACPENELAVLDRSLQSSGHDWVTSTHSLRSFLHSYFVNSHPKGSLKIEYVTQMTDVIKHLSLEAHRGIEKCLLNMLCRTREGRLPFYVDDGGTPDSLLSSVHGH